MFILKPIFNGFFHKEKGYFRIKEEYVYINKETEDF